MNYRVRPEHRHPDKKRRSTISSHHGSSVYKTLSVLVLRTIPQTAFELKRIPLPTAKAPASEAIRPVEKTTASKERMLS